MLLHTIDQRRAQKTGIYAFGYQKPRMCVTILRIRNHTNRQFATYAPKKLRTPRTGEELQCTPRPGEDLQQYLPPLQCF